MATSGSVSFTNFYIDYWVSTSRPMYVDFSANWSVSGTTLTLSNIRVRTHFSGGYCHYNNYQVADILYNQSQQELTRKVSVWYFDNGWDATVSMSNVSVTVDYNATSYTFYYRNDNIHDGIWSGWKAITINFDSRVVNPTFSTVEIGYIDEEYASIFAMLSSYGVPDSKTGRYIEARILSSPSIDSIVFSQRETDSTTVSGNTSSLTPNTKYYYGAYASNTYGSNYVVEGSFVTLPLPFQLVMPLRQKEVSGNITAKIIATIEPGQGTEQISAKARYSIDEGQTYSSWQTYNTKVFYELGYAEFDIPNLPPNVSVHIQVYATNEQGDSQETVGTVFTTEVVRGQQKIYANQKYSYKIGRVYCKDKSGKSMCIKKIYAKDSVEGTSVLVYGPLG